MKDWIPNHTHTFWPHIWRLQWNNSTSQLKSTIKKGGGAIWRKELLKAMLQHHTAFFNLCWRPIAWLQHLLNSDHISTITIYSCHQTFLQQLIQHFAYLTLLYCSLFLRSYISTLIKMQTHVWKGIGQWWKRHLLLSLWFPYMKCLSPSPQAIADI